MIRSRLFAMIGATILYFAAQPSHAVLIDFEGAPIGAIASNIGDFIDVGDYRFTLSGGSSGFLQISASDIYVESGTIKLFAANNSEITLTRIDGAAFNLFSLDIGGSYVDPSSWVRWADSVDIIAGTSTTNVVLDGSPPVYQNVSLDYTGVSSVIFDPIINDGLGLNDYEFVIDNLVVTAVPLPAAAWLFGAGLLALVGVAKKYN